MTILYFILLGLPLLNYKNYHNNNNNIKINIRNVAGSQFIVINILKMEQHQPQQQRVAAKLRAELHFGENRSSCPWAARIIESLRCSQIVKQQITFELRQGDSK